MTSVMVNVYKWKLRAPCPWWEGREKKCSYYLCKKKDNSYRIKNVNSVAGMQYKFSEQEVNQLRLEHPDVDLMFDLVRTTMKVWANEGGEE